LHLTQNFCLKISKMEYEKRLLPKNEGNTDHGKHHFFLKQGKTVGRSLHASEMSFRTVEPSQNMSQTTLSRSVRLTIQ